MTERNKWMVRSGAMLVLLGFFLPTVMVSCAGVPEMGRTLTLQEIASLLELPLLYLTPIGALITLILALIPASEWVRSSQLLWGQVAGAVAGIAGILITMASLNSKLQETGFQITPQFGAVALAGGYLLIAVGVALQFSAPAVPAYPPITPASRSASSRQPLIEPAGTTPPPRTDEQLPNSDHIPTMINLADAYAQDAPAQQTPMGEYLRMVQGNLSQSIIPLTRDGFTIGREAGNDLRLPAPNISRRHAVLRFGQGAWFIQDAESSGGTFVNGQRAGAHRLADGDEVRIGDYVFRFCRR